MANTRAIKRRISTAANISKITKAMEMVSASKMRRAQQQASASRAYARAIHASLQKVTRFTETTLHPLLQQNTAGHDVLLLISTDRGLCGGLNAHLFKATHRWCKDHPDGMVVSVGKKAATFMRKTSIRLHAQFADLPELLTISDTVAISQLVTRAYLTQEFRSVTLLYMDFINTLSQEVRFAPLLPISAEFAQNTKYKECILIQTQSVLEMIVKN
jgi:F-type H+-transporting ATPase subunit gamma